MERVPCFAGIDGGGTKSHMLVAGLNMEILCEVFSGTTNICATDEAVVASNIQSLFEQAEKKMSIKPDYKSVVLGTAGVTRRGAVETLTGMLLSITGCRNVTVTGDMVLPLYAYAPEGNATVVIAGTGSICYGKGKAGETARCGGWGHLFGDEGGGYWLACRALDAVMREHDARAEPTALTPLLLRHFNADSPTDMISKLYSGTFEKSLIASAAICVAAAAASGDEAANVILRDAAEQLFRLVEGVSRSLGQPDRVLLGGSVLVKNHMLQQILRHMIEAAFPHTKILLFNNIAGTGTSAAQGAIILANKRYMEMR